MVSNRKGPIVCLVFFICFLSCLLSGCSNGSEENNTDSGNWVSGKFIGFDGNEELLAYLKSQYSKSVYTDYPYALETTFAATGATVTSGESQMDAYTSESGGEYTGTNLQEQGVDEADSVKTDGSYFYIASGDTFVIVSVDSPMSIVSSTQVDGRIDSLYLYNDMAILLYNPTDYEGVSWVDPGMTGIELIGIPYWIPVQVKTAVAFYDVSNPASPNLLKAVEADGYLVSSRRIENHLHIVQQFLPDLPMPDVLEEEIQDMTLEELAPLYTETTDAVTWRQHLQLVAPEDFYHPSIDGGGSIVSIVSFDLDDPGLGFTSTGVVADASIVYASTQAMYFTSTYWNSMEDTLEEPLQQSVIYKFSLAEGQPAGQGYQSVNGRVLNQFSLGEYDGVLRIATTTGWAWATDGTSENHVYCLQSRNGGLDVIGSLEGIAPGEELYAARFIGTRGYLVTFVKIDPLFTLDLSDPTAPMVAGELKVPGYSSYIHPYGDNYLLCIGKDAVEEEGFAWYQGVQMSIFDISDFSDPTLLHNVIIGDRGTSSEALYNHKAFTFWEENGLLALPIDLYELQDPPEYPYSYGEQTFEGVYVYDVGTDSGFQFAGRISTQPEEEPISFIYNQWTRGIFIGDRIYAVTPNAIYVASVDDLEGPVESIDFE